MLSMLTSVVFGLAAVASAASIQSSHLEERDSEGDAFCGAGKQYSPSTCTCESTASVKAAVEAAALAAGLNISATVTVGSLEYWSQPACGPNSWAYCTDGDTWCHWDLKDPRCLAKPKNLPICIDVVACAGEVAAVDCAAPQGTVYTDIDVLPEVKTKIEKIRQHAFIKLDKARTLFSDACIKGCGCDGQECHSECKNVIAFNATTHLLEKLANGQGYVQGHLGLAACLIGTVKATASASASTTVYIGESVLHSAATISLGLYQCLGTTLWKVLASILASAKLATNYWCSCY